MIYCSDAHLSKASSVRTTRTFRPDLPLCREASNCSSLHLSKRFSSTSGRLLVFNKLQDFFPKHSKCVDSRPSVLIHKASIAFKSRHSDDGPHGPDARASDMEIACIRSTVRTTILLVWTREALVWKLLAAEVRPSGRQGTTVRTLLKTGKNFSEIFRKPIELLSFRTPYDNSPDGA
jgi:hypothetical protein